MEKQKLLSRLLFPALLIAIPFLSDAQKKIRVLHAITNSPVENAIIEDLSQQPLGYTDKTGDFMLTGSSPEAIRIKYEGFAPEVVKLPTNGSYTITIKPIQAKEEVTVLYGKTPKEFITGSVSSIQGSVVENIAATNRLNTVAGRLTGLGIMQATGLQTSEDSDVKIRGQHTIGNRPGVTVLVDGRQTDIRMIDPYDIESITILKDAAATAIYGMFATNGIVMVNTKRGEAGKLKVNYNGQVTSQQPMRLPKFLDSYHYAVLYNEAMLNDDPNATPQYSLHDLAGYRSGRSPYAYPNVDWTDFFLKDHTFQTRHNINISGGTEAAKYYVSFGYLKNGGIFNVDKNINTYNTNSKLDVFNIHGNLELKINKDFTVMTDIKAKKDMRTTPGNYSDTYDQTILTALYATPSNAFQPINYNGTLGGWYNGENPYGLLNHSGYSNFETNFISATIDLKYDLSDLVKGLSVFGYFGINSSTDYITNRSKTYAYYILNASGTIWYKRSDDGTIEGSGRYSSISRKYDHMAGLNYTRTFGEHYLDVSAMYDRQQLKEHIYSSIGETFQGLKTKLTYRFKEKYLLDLAASYQGSNYYPPGNRSGFFPALSAGWIISKEDFITNEELVNFLKIRASVGKSGNTIGTANATYYGYLDNFSSGNGGYFGTSLTRSTGMYQSRVANPGLTWETALKYNAGIDFSFFSNRLNGSVDYFNEENKNILVKNATSVMYGAEVWMPEGRMSNKGYEIELGWSDRVDKVGYSISGNISYAKNIVKEKNEEDRAYPWMYETGHPYGTRFGYVFDRFFTEEDDISALPNQSLLGDVQPGDLKYKDLNNDGIIDENDRTVIGRHRTPEIYYGFSMGLNYQGFDLSVLFQGIGNCATYNSGYTYWPFNNQTGDVLEHHLNRWTPGSGQNAEYPRLSLSSPNNTQTSSFWVQDSRFLRLKNVELGYTLPAEITKKISLARIRVYANGNNLITWDKVKHRDPEGAESGLRYPITRSITCGVNISF